MGSTFILALALLTPLSQFAYNTCPIDAHCPSVGGIAFTGIPPTAHVSFYKKREYLSYRAGYEQGYDDGKRRGICQTVHTLRSMADLPESGPMAGCTKEEWDLE